MALETLKGVKVIGGYPVYQSSHMDELDIPDGEMPIIVDHPCNTIMFKIQNGPIKEVGKNGCQVDTLIHTAQLMLEGLNKKFPCKENAMAIINLIDALRCLDARTKDREKRGVEGYSKA